MLQVYDLVKHYGDTPALRGASLHVAPGETVVLMGPSGCGKSTLIRCINRLIEPDSGEIWFQGRSVRDMTDDALMAYRRRVGFVFQHFNLVERLTVAENTALGLVMAGTPQEEAMVRAHRMLTMVGIGPSMLHRHPSALSGGQRQRVGIARAMTSQPDLMLWDEPTASLDPILVQEVLAVMEELAVGAGAGMLVVTHEMAFALRAANRIVLMDHGRIVEEGTPQDVFTAPTSDVGLRYRKLWLARHLDTGTHENRSESGRKKAYPVVTPTGQPAHMPIHAGTSVQVQKRTAAG